MKWAIYVRVDQAGGINGFVLKNVTFYNGLSINMLPCLHTRRKSEQLLFMIV